MTSWDVNLGKGETCTIIHETFVLWACVDLCTGQEAFGVQRTTWRVVFFFLCIHVHHVGVELNWPSLAVGVLLIELTHGPNDARMLKSVHQGQMSKQSSQDKYKGSSRDFGGLDVYRSLFTCGYHIYNLSPEMILGSGVLGNWLDQEDLNLKDGMESH